MLFWVENDIFLWICLFWPTSSKNDVYFFQSRSLAESRFRNPGLEYKESLCSLFLLLWNMTPCSLVGVYRRFRDAYCAMMMEALRISETSAYSYETIQCHISEVCHILCCSCWRKWSSISALASVEVAFRSIWHQYGSKLELPEKCHLKYVESVRIIYIYIYIYI
jgi:hypothetical protein